MAKGKTMRTRTIFGCITLVLLACPPAPWAQTPDCDALPADRKAIARDIFAALHPYAGCDGTYARCLAAKPPKPVVLRLASGICRQVKAGDDRKQVERNLAKRAQTMLASGPRAVIAVDEATRAGVAEAPIELAVYACPRCPFCKGMVTALYQAVTAGPLAGKARLYLRPFPLKTHADATEGGLAMVSAAKLGHFWPFVLALYKNFDHYCPKLLPDWAATAGMDRAAFENATQDPKTREVLVAVKQEGVRNKVNATPTVFIDGRQYLYDLSPESVIDVVEEAYEARMAKK
jgi:protein-disulfide isomerase